MGNIIYKRWFLNLKCHISLILNGCFSISNYNAIIKNLNIATSSSNYK